MRKHGWQLPYHPLQVVAVAVFLALGFAFYVFFIPFVGSKMFQYVLMGIYTPLITCMFCLYIWCAAADPADPGVFKSKKYLNTVGHRKHTRVKDSELEGKSTSSLNDANVATAGESATNESEMSRLSDRRSCCLVLLGWSPCAFIWSCSRQPEESADQQMSEDGMFYCSLCEVEVYKYSKHCRVCDKCVNHFDHHCRWINNCIGKKNYRQFFTLMLSALILLIVQWLIGILVMIRALLGRNRFTLEITSKLGSSFSMAAFVVVVASCIILAMIATLPLAQLFVFHVLLIKKGISTYDYIIALREQEQEQQGVEGQQSPPMSLASSRTGLSSGSSFNTFHRGAWCTPPRLFLEDQFDVVPPNTGMFVSSSGKKMVGEEPIRKKNPGAVKISPWTLAQLNAEEVSKVAAQARKKSKVLQPVVRREASFGLERHGSFSSSSSQMDPRPETHKHSNKQVRLPADLPRQTLGNISTKAAESKLNDLLAETSTSLAPLQLEARSAFHTSRALSASTSIVASSSESSLESPDLHSFRISSSGAEETRELTAQSAAGSSYHKGVPFPRSTSDGYDASGGEDSDWVPSRIGHRAMNWKN